MSINPHLSDYLINDISRPFIDGMGKKWRASQAPVSFEKGKGLAYVRI